MRLLDRDNDRPLSRVNALLTINEARELRDALDRLLNAKSNAKAHAHVCADDYQKELTIALYGDEYTKHLDERSQKLIVTDA